MIWKHTACLLDEHRTLMVPMVHTGTSMNVTVCPRCFNEGQPRAEREA